MDKLIYEFFKELKFSDGEIKTLISISPTIEEASASELISNMNAVVEAGYPADDIGYLISTNPSFLSRNTEDLKSDLANIILEYGDLEQALKNDPDLI